MASSASACFLPLPLSLVPGSGTLLNSAAWCCLSLWTTRLGAPCLRFSSLRVAGHGRYQGSISLTHVLGLLPAQVRCCPWPAARDMARFCPGGRSLAGAKLCVLTMEVPWPIFAALCSQMQASRKHVAVSLAGLSLMAFLCSLHDVGRCGHIGRLDSEMDAKDVSLSQLPTI